MADPARWWTRVAGYHNNSLGPNGLWQFNGSFADVGVAPVPMDLTLSGPERWGELWPGLRCFKSAPGAGTPELTRPAYDADLDLFGEMSIGMLVAGGWSTGLAHLASFGTAWRVEVGSDQRPRWLQGGGAAWTAPFYLYERMPYSLWFTRDAGNVVRAYVQGRLVGTSGAQTAVEAGDNDDSRLFVMRSPEGTGSNTSVSIASLKIVPFCLSGSQVSDQHIFSMGAVYPALILP